MINELFTLYRCLHKCGIQVGEPHQDVKTPGKGEGFIIGINKDGKPETLEFVAAENMSKLWTLRKGKHNSFPYIKLKKPIFATTATDQIYEDYGNTKKIEKKKELMVGVRELHKLNEQGVLAQWTKDQLEAIKGKDKKLGALVTLSGRMPANKSKSAELFKEIVELLLNNLNEQGSDLIKVILIGYIKKEKGKEKIACDVPLFFDLSDWNNYKLRVACPEMGILVGENLPKSKENSLEGFSAFGGRGIHAGSYPDPTLPAVGIAYLFSMNEDALCHKRYGKIASEIFPTSVDEVKAMHGALQWCVAKERKGKTWQCVPNIKRKQDLVITYLEEKPQAEIDLASTFATFDTTEDETGETIYEEMTAKVYAALKGEAGLTKDSKVNILVITKVDEGRAQVVLSGAYSIENIINSIEQWRIAAKNRPHFSIFLPGKKGEKAKVVEPFCPSPTEIMRCLQNQWIKKGLDRRDVPGVALRHVYELFLGNGRISPEAARMFLQLTLQRLGPLFIGIAGADHGGDVKDFKPEARRAVLVGISLLAIALYKLGIKKEEYMKNAAFSVGRLLAFADGLHAQYCKLQMKRKGDLPPQLIGNAYLPIALDSPNKALALLSDRLRIYYAWATKVQGEEYKLVKWMMGEMGKISAGLENVAWPSMADDAVKTQLLLGYLARSKSEE